MKALLLPIFLVLTAGAAEKAPVLRDMTPGRYEVRVEGMLCRTCAKAAAEELSRLKEVRQAVADFDQETLFITVRLDKTLKVSKIRKALNRAASRVDLEAKYEIANIRYRLDTKDLGEKAAPKKKKKK